LAKKLILTVLISATIFSTFCFGTSAIGISTNPPAENLSSSPLPLYTVKTYGDIIGVFYYGEAVPFRLLDVSANSLPPQDVDTLKVGISLYSDEDLFSIIEDLNS